MKVVWCCLLFWFVRLLCFFVLICFCCVGDCLRVDFCWLTRAFGNSTIILGCDRSSTIGFQGSVSDIFCFKS